MGRHRRGGVGGARRRGPAAEAPWWDPADQQLVEQRLLVPRDLGRGWVAVPMVNNRERIDPYEGVAVAADLVAARAARRLTALDEGAAWRRRRDGALVVARLEVFAAGHAEAVRHREAWRAHGPEGLDALWRARWRERGRDPGWIEARWRDDPDRPVPLVAGGSAGGLPAAAVDWLEVEDQTGVHDTGVVTCYQHLTVWSGRALATLTVRHDQVAEVDDAAVAAAARAWSLLAPRRDGGDVSRRRA